ncbi:hypothetical protein PZ61_0201775 [Streptomyces sp. MNU77]|uniref:hypothetical protein n=1 Tax=Streptomyces sp. MNU77 TaxID=1573406 RepID=UPI0005E16AE8|nr:hypothetical protein [Streptomyces sp. MNU77]OLO29348.1 hypothetical protein PZ61_0201775 [Streptomyces sp. MNU77]
MTRSRLAPGTGIVTPPGGAPVLRTSGGEFLRIDTGGVTGEDLVRRLAGEGATEEAVPGEETPVGGAYAAELARLVEAFEAAGHALSAPPPAPLAGRTVHLLGDPVLTAPVARCARAEGAEVHRITPDGVAELARSAPDDGAERRVAVVWCLDSPVPDGLWDTADRLPARRIAWLRCHREGAHSWIEPLAAAPGDVTSRHVRLRRLAATPAHRELAAYWAGHRTPDTGPHPTEASAALIAALLTADLIAWAEAEAEAEAEAGEVAGVGAGVSRAAVLPVRRRLRRIDLRNLTLTEHPVLPVPDVAPLPVPAAVRTCAGAGTAEARP